MSAHTPGPWEARRDPCHFGTLSSVVGGETLAGRIDRELMVEVGGRGTVGTQEANTRLIAAAPDLLKALKGLCAQGDEILDRQESGNPIQTYLLHEALEKARKAIAKAKGETT